MTHCDRVLDLLADGEPHSHHELYNLNVIAHSRVSDLRKRGHTIEMWREDDLYLYRLQDSGTEPSGQPSSLGKVVPPVGPDRSADVANPLRSTSSVPVQLRLVEAA